MPSTRLQTPSGHVFRVDRKRGPVWYAKYRLPTGKQVQRKLGPAWTERGRPPAGYLTKRGAEDTLRRLLDEIRHGTLPGMVVTGATFADAAAEFLRYAEQDRGCKPSTMIEYRSAINAHLVPAFGDERIESLTSEGIERWRGSLEGVSNRTRNKLLVVLHGVLHRAQNVYGLSVNPAAKVERLRERRSGDIESSQPRR